MLSIRAALCVSFLAVIYLADVFSAEPPKTAVSQPADSGITGVVVSPSGQPVAGATLFLCPRSDFFSMEDGRPSRHESRRKEEPIPEATSDAQGRFRLVATDDPFVVVALAEEGYGELSDDEVEKDTTVRLVNWCTLTGTAKIGTELAVGRKMVASVCFRYENRVGHRVSAKVDQLGRYEIRRVPPGNVYCSIQSEHDESIGWRLMSCLPSHYSFAVCLQEGETANLDFGGFGRPVIGRLLMPDDFEWKPDDPHDPSLANGSIDFRSIGPAKKVRGHVIDRYGLQPSRLGEFRIDDVLPGSYVLHYFVMNRYGPLDRTKGVLHSYFVSAVIDIPEANDGAASKPFDLGGIKLMPDEERTPKRRLAALGQGAPAPLFDIESLTGSRLRLSDFKGKYVVLDFWATWCGPCKVELPGLRKLHEKFGSDDRFAIVSLSLDKDSEVLRKFVEKEKLNWSHGIVVDRSKIDVPKAYGVEGIPAVFLIGPDGKIILSRPRYEQLKRELTNRLSLPTTTQISSD